MKIGRFQISTYEGVLWFLVGLSSWLTINALFAESTYLVAHLPESWKLYSYLTIIVQFGNIGPIIAKLCPPETYHIISILIIAIGIASMAGMAFLWDGIWFGHSIWLFCFTFTASIADCTSSVTYWTLSASAGAGVIVWLSAGEAATSLLANILSLIQQPGSDNPRFGPLYFFLANSCILCISLFAFLVLKPRAQSTDVENAINQRATQLHRYHYIADVVDPSDISSRWNYWKPFFWMAVLNFLSNGVGASIGGYATLPYGLHISQYDGNIKGILMPFAAFSPHFLGYRFLWTSISFTVLINMWIVCWALLSPDPPGVGTSWSVAVISADIFGTLCLTYAKCALTLKYSQLQEDVTTFMTNLGLSMQVGSFLGALFGFLLVNIFNCFKE